MDAHSTVTAEEGDRYPLGPPDSLQGHSLPQTSVTGVTVEERPEPYKSTLRIQKRVEATREPLTVCFYMVHSYNGHYPGLSIRRREFDSPMHRQVL